MAKKNKPDGEPEGILHEYRHELMRYDHMTRAIRACGAVDEVKKIRNKAVAAEVYAAQAKNYELEEQATKIRLRAEHRCGELMKEMAEGGERHSGHGNLRRGRKSPESPEVTPEKGAPNLPTLADFGLTKNQSADWQRLAEIPEAEFEEMLDDEPKPTTAGLITRAKAAGYTAQKSKKSPLKASSPDAVWVWGRIVDLEGRLKLDPHVLGESMEPTMRKDIKRIVPLLVEWLQKLI